MPEMRSTQDRANGSLWEHSREVMADMSAMVPELGTAAIGFAILIAIWLLAPLSVPLLAWYRRRAARREVAAWEARCARNRE